MKTQNFTALQILGHSGSGDRFGCRCQKRDFRFLSFLGRSRANEAYSSRLCTSNGVLKKTFLSPGRFGRFLCDLEPSTLVALAKWGGGFDPTVARSAANKKKRNTRRVAETPKLLGFLEHTK